MNIFSNRFVFAIVVLIVVGGVSVGAVFAFGYRFTKVLDLKNIDNPQALVQAISKHIAVNLQESPSIATVQKPDVLRSQNAFFYRDAQEGDRVVVWTDKVVLYSPSKDRLLSVLPVTAAQVPPQATMVIAPSPVSSPLAADAEKVSKVGQVTIDVRNGTGRSGLGSVAAQKLKQAGYTVLSPMDAHGVQSKTVLYKSMNADLDKIMMEIRALVPSQIVTELPKGETAAKGDIVIILGQDYSK